MFAGAASEDDVQAESSCCPGLTGAIRDYLNIKGTEKVLGLLMVPMLVLYPAEQRELVIRPQMKLERTDPGQRVVVDALGIVTVRLAA